MRKKIVVAVVCSLWSTLIYAQNSKTIEAGFVTDNDLYISTSRDQYYTNGIELYYRYLTHKKSETLEKKTVEFRAGQYMYNPQTVRAVSISLHDRPFAGYLFAEAGISNFYKDESVLKFSGQLGILGPGAGAEGLQKELHKVLKLDSISGWEYQIKKAVGVQVNAFYSRKILPQTFSQNIDFNFTSKANWGTIWTGAQVGIMTRISIAKLLPVFDSNLFGASVSRTAKEKNREFYLYFTPNLNYQIYDATIQGSMFNNDSPIVFDVKPWRFIGEVGLKFRRNNWNLSYSFIYKSKELINNAVTSHYYGSITISRLFGS
ncbi:lipid A deacylase LpxR family protein [Flavobacterium sp. '19STA2R22 D10 B1']|uniref:lipid A deacylase LpxR family protein n=1 Tax=Flavobacterium aerium TaxID=3037261 RepID=UPI00278C26AF|nr:lipid A deacylase LpxR family protein [Flavobacterium sp. '19STA2R22 D10 B1']